MFHAIKSARRAKRVLLASCCMLAALAVLGVVALMQYDPEVPDVVLRQRLEAKLVGHSVRGIDRVFAEEHVERTDQLGLDGLMRDAGHEDFVTKKHIFVHVHTDGQSKVISVDTVGQWVGR